MSAALPASDPPVEQSVQRRTLPRFTDRISIGRGLRVSPFCLGLTSSPDVVISAFERGVNFFFLTADMHWPLYESTRRGVAQLFARGGGIREQIVVAGVCYPTQPEFCIVPFEELVDSVPGLERVDVLVAGGSYSADLLPRLRVLDRVAAQRQARAVATTFHDRSAAVFAANHGLIDLGFIRYNPAHPGAQRDLFPLLQKNRSTPLFNFKSTMGYVPPEQLAAGGLSPDLWFPSPADYYRYALSREELSGILFACDRETHLDELSAALERGGLSAEEQRHLEELAVITRQNGNMS